MLGEWKSINKIMVEVSIPETTARRYLSTFSEFFAVKQFNKVKKYREDSGQILRRIAELYDQKKTTTEIKAILKSEGVVQSPGSKDRRQAKQEVKQVEAEIHRAPEPSASVSIETLSQQNLVIMATLQELATGIKMINDQREEIALLKREIKELRLQLVSVAETASHASSVVREREKNRSSKDGKSVKEYNFLEEFEDESDVSETSEHIDEVVPNEPVVLPRTIDRQQLADIIAELRANEPNIEPPPAIVPAPVRQEDEIVEEMPVREMPLENLNLSDIPSFQDDVNQEEAAILLNKSYTPPTTADDNSNLSRVNSRSSSRTRQEDKRWWQFWK